MKTKANVYLLPTDDKSNIILSGFGTLFLTPPMQLKSSDTYQHLYITLPQSDLEISKIKYKDYWLYNCPINGIDFGDNNKPFVENTLPDGIKWFSKLHDIKNYEKIIATTDTSLSTLMSGSKKEGKAGIYRMFPSISQQFIEYFIDEYNKGNVIKEVDVELEPDWENINEICKLKLNQQNEISIIMNKSDKEKALKWYNELPQQHKEQLYLSYYGCRATDKFPDEIMEIWRIETQNNSPLDTFSPEDFSDDGSDPKEQKVDFDRIQTTTNRLFNQLNDENLYIFKLCTVAEIKNLQLFFKLLSTKPTFAKKAYEELSKFNK
jgi:hypothetical protein